MYTHITRKRDTSDATDIGEFRRLPSRQWHAVDGTFFAIILQESLQASTAAGASCCGWQDGKRRTQGQDETQEQRQPAHECG